MPELTFVLSLFAIFGSVISDRSVNASSSFPSGGDYNITLTRRPRWTAHFSYGYNSTHVSREELLNWGDNTFPLEVLSNERVTHKQHFQDVRLIRVRSRPCQTYAPGDYALVRARNSPAAVDQLLSLLNTLPADATFTLGAVEGAFPVPLALTGPLTIRLCASQYWDLSAIPQRHVFELLLRFATSERERDLLGMLSRPEDHQRLLEYCSAPRKSVLEVLADFPSATANLPLPYLFEIFRPIRLRAYSIASSPTVHPGEVHVLVAVVQYNTSAPRPRRGLCSDWLASRQVADTVQIAVRPGSFKFPNDTSVPLVLVGPGTGVAPYRSLVLERAAARHARADRLMLVFGCRRRAGDYYLRREWEALEAQGELTLLTAFSRDQPQKIYVQHVLCREAAQVYDWLRRGGWVFVCGSASLMPADVRRALVHVVQAAGGVTPEHAERYIADLEARGNYQTVVWS